MSGSSIGGGGGRESDPPLSASPRVQLEIDILAGEDSSRETLDAQRRTILAVTSDEGLSRYLALCLSTRSDLQLATAASVEQAVTTAALLPPHAVIADVMRADVIRALHEVPALLIVDDAADADVTPLHNARTPVAVMVRPFNAHSLLLRLDELL
jgi:hypothetical protein